MKKLCIFISFLFVFLFGITATAAETPTVPYANAWELYQVWYENYPDYISGIWSTDGGMNLTFGIAEEADFEETKNEILALIENDGSASFAQQKYSYNYLKEIQEYMNTYFTNYDPSLGLSAMGIYEMDNYVGIDFLEEKKDEQPVKDFVKLLIDKYGDAVQINYSEGVVHTLLEEPVPDIGLATITLAEPTQNYLPVILLIGIAVVIACTIGGIAYAKKRKAAVLQTVSGQTITTNMPANVKQTEIAVKNATLTPNSELDKKILEKTE